MYLRKSALFIICLIFLFTLPAFAGGRDEEAPIPEPTEPEAPAPQPTEEVVITLWTTEEQPERIAVQEEISEMFKEASGITVKVVPVSENLMAERATAAFASGNLPDVIYHPLKNTWSWADAGILDSFAATEAMNELGADTFLSAALDKVSDGNDYVAVPVDGWTQLLVYREDLFTAAGLNAPSTYDDILVAIEALHNPPEMYGFVAATDPDQGYTMQVFEHVALANGVQLVDTQGQVVVNSPKLVETLEFYKKLAAASPPGNLFWQHSRELYLAGKAAMIIWSPFLLDELAGLRDSAPVTVSDDPTTKELAQKTAFLGSLAGPSNPSGAGWADYRYFGITVDANIEAAVEFVKFSMNEGYVKTLAIAPEGKFPIRNGTQDDPNKFIDAWLALDVGVDRREALSNTYDKEVITTMRDGLQTGTRWGFEDKYFSVMSKVYETKTVAGLIREFLDGKYDAQKTAELIAEEVQKFVP